jgi:hypothetical protein
MASWPGQRGSVFVLLLLITVRVTQGIARHDPSHSLLTEVLRDHVTDGNVDYTAIRNDGRFVDYLASLRLVDPSSIKNRDERMAFWINAYNAFTIQLILDHYPVESIRDIQVNGKGAWDIMWIGIGESTYSLNQIEHEILLKQYDEPRIHMALVCAARSCPPLRPEAYVGEKLSPQLEDNTRIFLTDATKNRFEKETHTLFLSELFSWYGGDFVKKYGSVSSFVLNVLGAPEGSSPTIKYLPYDWALNSR